MLRPHDRPVRVPLGYAGVSRDQIDHVAAHGRTRRAARHRGLDRAASSCLAAVAPVTGGHAGPGGLAAGGDPVTRAGAGPAAGGDPADTALRRSKALIAIAPQWPRAMVRPATARLWTKKPATEASKSHQSSETCIESLVPRPTRSDEDVRRPDDVAGTQSASVRAGQCTRRLASPTESVTAAGSNVAPEMFRAITRPDGTVTTRRPGFEGRAANHASV